MRNQSVLVLLHNLGMILFVLLIAFNRSSANQIILSVIAGVYWLLGYNDLQKKIKHGDSEIV